MTQYNKNSRKELHGISEEDLDMVVLVIKSTGPDVSVLIIIMLLALVSYPDPNPSLVWGRD